MSNTHLLIAALSLVLLVLSGVVGVVWRLSSALRDLSVAISDLKTEIVENTMDERERTDRKIKEAIAQCRVNHSAQAHGMVPAN